jgi:hypothetical protein
LNYNIPVRLAKLGRHQTEIIDILRSSGENITPAEFSRYIRGKENPPKSERILAEADKVVTEWEGGEQ